MENSRLTLGSFFMTAFMALIIIQCILVILKVSDVLALNWVWTLSPVIAIGTAIILFISYLIIYAMIVVFGHGIERKHKQNNSDTKSVNNE